MHEAWQKYKELLERIEGLQRVVVAFSGGVDSAFLLKAALIAVGRENVMAVTADSETYPEREREAAKEIAKELDAQHMIIATSELAIPGYAENPINRCYFCKHELFSQLLPIAKEQGYSHVVFGAIADDFGDFRPGLKAATDKGVYAPMQDVMLYKREIRFLSRELGLRTWDKPSMACLSSRIPYGQRITSEKLDMVDQAEFFIMQLGFRQVRVRHHEEIARIEVPQGEMVNLMQMSEMVVAKFKEIGYRYVTIDLQGFRSGSLNESIQPIV